MSTVPCDDLLSALQHPEPANPKVEELFEEIQRTLHSPETIQRARRRGLDGADLEDAGTRCLLKLMRKRHQIECGKNWRSFARVSFERFIIDQARIKYRHPAAVLGTGGIDLADDAPSPIDLLIASEDRERLVRLLLAGADARSRRVVKMRLAGATFEKIAAKRKVCLTVVFRAWSKQVLAAREAAAGTE